ncbi:zinc-ribbon domain containing protein [bacterium]|nr:zinc-ribbon domain containing protein [bacterium]
MAYSDLTLHCSDCGDSFTFTAGEQEFHAQKGFSNRPGRCPSCRAARKKNAGDQSGPRHDRQGGGQRSMHSAVCSGCGQQTEVPFQPTQDRPVYCRSCFATQGGKRTMRR